MLSLVLALSTGHVDAEHSSEAAVENIRRILSVGESIRIPADPVYRRLSWRCELTAWRSLSAFLACTSRGPEHSALDQRRADGGVLPADRAGARARTVRRRTFRSS